MAGGEPTLIRVLEEQRRRCVAAVMGAGQEGGWWDRLNESERNQFRQAVVRHVGVLYDLARDIARATEPSRTDRPDRSIRS